MTAQLDHIAGHTYHGRRGAVDNRFTYGIDYVLLDAEGPVEAPVLFGRNRPGLWSLHDRDHGGAPKRGEGASWVREVLAEHGLADLVHRIELLAQPRTLGHVFNPVSFWLVRDRQSRLRVVLAEVTNTFGDRHSYLCHRDDHGPIGPRDVLRAHKVFHVSPFQEVAGGYAFTFDIDRARIAIRIDFRDAPGGLIATLAGKRTPLTTRAMLAAALRRPFGARRVLALIHWQALKLWWKGALYRSRPEPPAVAVSPALPKDRQIPGHGAERISTSHG